MTRLIIAAFINKNLSFIYKLLFQPQLLIFFTKQYCDYIRKEYVPVLNKIQREKTIWK